MAAPAVLRRMAVSLLVVTYLEIDAGHLLPYEEPAAFAAAVREFLAGLDCMSVM